MDFDDQEDVIKKSLAEKTKYKEVAPTWELNMETYGQTAKKAYDPDYEHVEMSKFREFERLETQGMYLHKSSCHVVEVFLPRS